MSCHIDPERDQFEAFKKLPRDKPIMMLNLLRFRDKAAYEDGREVSGAAAYATYGRESAPIFQRVGGEIVWRGYTGTYGHRPQRPALGSHFYCTLSNGRRFSRNGHRSGLQERRQASPGGGP